MKRSKLVTLPLAALLLGTLGAGHAGTEVVTEDDVVRQPENSTPTNEWVLFTRAGTPPTAGAFVDGPSDPPLGNGSFQTVTATGSEKVYLFNYEHLGTPIADVDAISYSTYRTVGNAQQLPSLNLQVDFNGDAAGGFTTLVFEPVYNNGEQPVVSGEWQDWTADGDGRWWSTSAINGQGAGAPTANLRTWDQIVANNPEAFITGGIGINQGSGNPGLDANTDAFTFDEVTYDFERIRDEDGDGIPDTAPPTDKDQCKKGGYADFNNPSFKNQGQCVSYVQADAKAGKR